MNPRRLLASVAVLSACLANPLPAGAHRVDEYLQASRLSIDTEHVELEMDLTAGMAVAPEVFSSIDTNRDGEISEAEGEAYARQVLGSVVLSVDNWPVSVTLVESRFPSFREMSLGLGSIRLRASAKVPATAAGHHQVSFLNTHRPGMSVYLVNALVPANPRIRLGEQRRDKAQHGLTLDYNVRPASPSAAAFALLAGVFIAGFWLLRRTLSSHAYFAIRRNRFH